MSDDAINKMIEYVVSICKWFFLQMLLFFLMPYIWEEHFCSSTIILILLYTSLYAIYWEYTPREKRFHRILYPYLIYSIVTIALYSLIDDWNTSIWFCLILPIYGAICVICTKLIGKFNRKLRKKYKLGKVISFCILISFFIALKSLSVSWECREQGTFNGEKDEILGRRNYLVDKLITTPENVLNEMPSSIGEQFQGEWALYSCSMLSAALVNLSNLYPETKKENIQLIDSLIHIVISPELRYYDTMRWGEDPLETLDGEESHISYISHLAWMICGYKNIGGDGKYDKLLSSLCSTMNRRILSSNSFNLPTYPGESIYIPDMLVAIVALDQYADINKGKYRTTVNKWIERARKDWLDEKTGLLVSFLKEDGHQYEGVPVKGSYSALNCYYLTFIDENLAKEQYEALKSLFWKNGLISGLKEYYDRSCYIGLDIDAGPILFELSPSGTAFIAGASTFFNDIEARREILTTAEIAGQTIRWNNQRHYLLANVALVGESIMLAMRTHTK